MYSFFDPETMASIIINAILESYIMNQQPYTDEKIGDGIWIRTFDPVVTDSEEYIWHKDNKDRTITVLEGEGWQFQFDDDIPKSINIGEKLYIRKHVYHRIIIGKTILKLKIEEGTG